MDDNDDHYAIQISENTRYASDLLKRIPNLRRGEYYKFTPYDFDKNGKRKQGFSIKTIDDNPVDSFYGKFTQTEDGWRVDLMNGLPAYDGDPKDRDELKIYFMRVTKILRDKALAFIGEHFQYEKPTDVTQDNGFDEDIPMPDEGDIPF